jgi:hypothetical protein
MRASRRARSRLLRPGLMRIRCGMQMALSTAGGASWFASGRITLRQERRSLRWPRQPRWCDRPRGSRLGERLLFDATSQPRWKPHLLADLAPSRYAVGGDRGLGRGHPSGRDNRKSAPGHGRATRVGVPAGMVASWDLYFVSDRGSGWWNLYREHAGAIEPMAEMNAEFGRPQWQFGMST